MPGNWKTHGRRPADEAGAEAKAEVATIRRTDHRHRRAGSRLNETGDQTSATLRGWRSCIHERTTGFPRAVDKRPAKRSEGLAAAGPPPPAGGYDKSR